MVLDQGSSGPIGRPKTDARGFRDAQIKEDRSVVGLFEDMLEIAAGLGA